MEGSGDDEDSGAYDSSSSCSRGPFSRDSRATATTTNWTGIKSSRSGTNCVAGTTKRRDDVDRSDERPNGETSRATLPSSGKGRPTPSSFARAHALKALRTDLSYTPSRTNFVSDGTGAASRRIRRDHPAFHFDAGQNRGGVSQDMEGLSRLPLRNRTEPGRASSCGSRWDSGPGYRRRPRRWERQRDGPSSTPVIACPTWKRTCTDGRNGST